MSWCRATKIGALIACFGTTNVAEAQLRIAITIDDLPFLGETRESAPHARATGTRKILSALRRHNAPATAFVTCGRSPEDLELVREWSAAGIELANHSTAHRATDELDDAAWSSDIGRCSDKIAELAGSRPRFFRFPFLRTGETAARRDSRAESIRALGMRVAPVTIDTSDWLLASTYPSALSQTARTIGRAFVTHIDDAVTHYEDVSRKRHARSVNHILLLHATALTADYLESLLATLTRRGATFISLEEALTDPVFALPDDYAGTVGMSWLYRTRPAAPDGWRWDSGQMRALASRFGMANEALSSTRSQPIDIGLRARQLTPYTTVITDDRPFTANCVVTELSDGRIAVIGSPYTPSATSKLIAWVKTRYGRLPSLAVATHFHFDASGGGAAFQAAGIPVYATRETAQLIAERQVGMRAGLIEMVENDPELVAEFSTMTVPPPTNQFPQSRGITIRAGGEPALTVMYPGAAHSPDNVVVWIPRDRVLFGGCMIRATGSLGYVGVANLQEWPRSLERLSRFPAELVVPGHGERFEPAMIGETRALLPR